MGKLGDMETLKQVAQLAVIAKQVADAVSAGAKAAELCRKRRQSGDPPNILPTQTCVTILNRFVSNVRLWTHQRRPSTAPLKSLPPGSETTFGIAEPTLLYIEDTPIIVKPGFTYCAETSACGGLEVEEYLADADGDLYADTREESEPSYFDDSSLSHRMAGDGNVNRRITEPLSIADLRAKRLAYFGQSTLAGPVAVQ